MSFCNQGFETLFVDEVPTAAEAGERRRYGEREELASGESATGDETISDDQVFEDAASHKRSDDDLDDVDRMLAEKQRDGRTFYLISRTITAKMKPHRSRRRI